MATDSNKRKLSNEELIALVKEQAAKLGRAPFKKEFPYGEVVRWRFGTWQAFLQEAGMEPPSRKVEFSDEELIQKVQEQAAELGRAPFRKEFELSHFANRQFGTWSNFIKSAGLELAENPRSRSTITNEELIESIHQETAKLGRVPLSTEFRHGPLARHRFGSWKEFLDQAGLEMSKLKKGVTNEELIALIQKETAEKGRTPLKKEFQYGGLITTRFGNWGNFLQQAGLEAGTLAMRRKEISNEQLIEIIHEKAKELGRTPYEGEFEYKSLVVGRFGTWGNFLSAAKLEPSKPRWRRIEVTNEELIKLVQEKAAELGRSPKAAEFHYGHLAKSRFGGWKNFLKNAGLTPETTRAYKNAITNEELIQLVQQQAQKLGRTPARTEFEYGNLAKKRFGKWTTFQKSAGLEPIKPGKPGHPIGDVRKITNEQLMEWVREAADELGRTPLMREFKYHGLVAKRFDGWKNFLQLAGLELYKPIHNLTNSELIKLVQQQEIDADQVPTAEEFKYSSTAIHRFGSWEEFLESAGLGQQRYKRSRKMITNNQLIERVQKQAEGLGRAPTVKEFKHVGIAVRRYGSWGNFLQRANLKPQRRGNERKLISNEQLIERVQKQAKELGRAPRRTEFKHIGIVLIRYDSWNSFLENAGLTVVRDKRPLSNEELIQLVQKEAKERGETPLRGEFEYARVAVKRYGNWNNFLKSAGLTKQKPKPYKKDMSNERLIRLVQQRAKELGGTPTLNQFEYSRLAISRYHSWSNFLRNAGLMPRHSKEYKEARKKELIELVRKQARELGKTPTQSEFKYGNKVNGSFGSWRSFLASAGLKPRTMKNPQSRMSDKTLIELVQKQAKVFGETPTYEEFEYKRLAIERYGDWKSFLASAGLEYRSPQADGSSKSNERLIELVQKQAEELGKRPTYKEFEYRYLAKKRYGSWKKFLASAGLEYRTSQGYVSGKSNEQLIELVQKQAEELGRTPRGKEFEYTYLVSKRYGSWEKFLKSAGLEYRSSRGYRSGKSNEQLIELVQKQAEELGRTPTNKEFEYSYLVTKRFGGWKKFLASAGLEYQKPQAHKNTKSNEQLIELVQKRAEELGKVPMYKEFEYSYLATKRYGGWKRFLASAGLEYQRPQKYTEGKSNEQLIELVQKQAKELRKVPTFVEFEHSYLASKRYGSWSNFLSAAGLSRKDFSFSSWLSKELRW